ncbi:MAG: hypothetical protein HQL30_02200 [Candidatus Omnitrophica bacterium]|nr:hypothetical protein [Candidatus Omnitrophota bacterium]
MTNILGRKKLLRTGLILFAGGFIVNAVLVSLHFGGLIRELARLTVIAGLLMTVFGIFKK